MLIPARQGRILMIEYRKPEDDDRNISRVVSQLIRAILAMAPGEQRQLLSDLRAANGVSKRQYSRKNCFTAVQFSCKEKLFSGYITDIGPGGVFVEISGKFHGINRGDSMILTFPHPDSGVDVRLEGRIARVRKTGVGVSFANLLEDLLR
ncbi:MAG: PilZ domain-containing protein [Deltaproteobacteria bacterium]|nr:PilZ domain-containing protein [Deltaproteobacteria bacterium]